MIRPFWFTDTVVLSASAAGTALLPVSAGEKARIRKLLFVATGAFSLTSLRDASGLPYSNCNTDNPITSTLLGNAVNGFNTVQEFEPALEIEGPNELNLALLDTSAASNTVRIVGVGEKET